MWIMTCVVGKSTTVTILPCEERSRCHAKDVKYHYFLEIQQVESSFKSKFHYRDEGNHDNIFMAWHSGHCGAWQDKFHL